MYPPSEEQVNPLYPPPEMQEQIIPDPSIQDPMAMMPQDPMDGMSLQDSELIAPESLVPQAPAPREFEKTQLHCLLEDIAKEYIRHEEFARDRIIQEARRNNLYDEGIQNIFISALSGSVGSWSTFNEYINSLDDLGDMDDVDTDIKFINIYKAYKESLTAALSAKVPATKFLPDDAENIDDIYTAEAFDKLASLVRRYNKSKMLLLQVISILINEGVACIHNYCDRDGKYGYTNEDLMGDIVRGSSQQECSNCGASLGTEDIPAQALQRYPDGTTQATPEDSMGFGEQSIPCPGCGMESPPLISTQYQQSQEVIGTQQKPKMRVIQEAYGITNVRFPAYAMNPGDIPMLTLEYEMSVAKAEDNWKHLKGKIKSTHYDSLNDNKWARNNSFYSGEVPRFVCTVQECWLRPWAFNILNSETFKGIELGEIDPGLGEINPETGEAWSTSEVFQQQYPDGIRLVLVNGEYAEHHEENIDEHWTVSYNPMYRYLISKSIGSSIVPIQDLANDNIAITEQTIEHSVMETFVDSKTIDLEKYKDSEIRPGSIIPVVGEPGESISNKFFQTKGATLSQEVGLFANRIESLGEFVSGAMPGVYGGDMPGSNTAAQYSMSRAQSLQRLTIPWDIICNLWSDMELKSLKDFAKNLDYDEKYTVPAGASYKNVYIKQIQLKGNVACVEPQSEGYFPMTFAQERDLLKELLTLNNPDINAVIMHPENRNVVGTYMGPTNLYIPGEEDRKKQLAEIAELLQGQPVPGPFDPMTGQPQMKPSIMPEPIVDDDNIHLEVCKRWAISVEGQSYKRDKPPAYQNVLAHAMAHYMNMQMKLAQQQPQPGNDVQPPQA